MGRFNLQSYAPTLEKGNIEAVRALIDLGTFRPRQDGQPHDREGVTLALLCKVHSREENISRPPPLNFDGDEDLRNLGALPGEWYFTVQYYHAKGCAATALGVKLFPEEAAEIEAFQARNAAEKAARKARKASPIAEGSEYKYWDDEVK